MSSTSTPGEASLALVEEVVTSFEALPRLSAADPDLVRRGRFLSGEIEIGVGAVPLAVAIAAGRVESVKRGPFLLRPMMFAIRAEPGVWRHFHEPLQAPGWHDLFALTKAGRARIDGDLVTLMGNLQYVKDLIALPRVLHAERAGR